MIASVMKLAELNEKQLGYSSSDIGPLYCRDFVVVEVARN